MFSAPHRNQHHALRGPLQNCRIDWNQLTPGTKVEAELKKPVSREQPSPNSWLGDALAAHELGVLVEDVAKRFLGVGNDLLGDATSGCGRLSVYFLIRF